MDALEILTNIEKVFPHFQAIFNAEDQLIIGYEIFGRIETDKGIQSLGPFFLDENVPEEFRLEVDQAILRKALDQFLALDGNQLMFINRDSDVLMYDNGEQLLSLLLEYEKKGLSLDRIVLESTERSFNGDTIHLDHLLNYLRTYGIKLAINNKGSDRSYMERIGQLSPNILKVDLNDIQAVGSTKTLQDILHSLSLLARKIGASLLFENIEMSFHLQFALRNGGRYFQGYYLHKPGEQFERSDILKERLIVEMEQFVKFENKKLISFTKLTEDFNSRMNRFLDRKKKYQSLDDLLHLLAREFNDIAFRLYATNSSGLQLSSNVKWEQERWISEEEYKGKNWCWRPYFISNIKVMNQSKKGILSDSYRDINSLDEIRTFSFNYEIDTFIFIDISSDYLYDKEL